MALRANWKGSLKVGELNCTVGLYTAASTSERIAFHTLNRQTGNRVKREFVDSETGDLVERDDQVKGYENTDGSYTVLEPEEVSAAVPEADKTLVAERFVKCDEIDDLYFDKPYYLVPADEDSEQVFFLIRNSLKNNKVAAIADTVLFRRVRTVLIRPFDKGLIATTLNFDYEVRSARDAFKEAPDIKIKDEFLELADHIISSKKGKFDPSTFDDRYEAALAEVVNAKIEGRKIKPKPEPETTKVVNLMEALRASVGLSKADSKARTVKSKAKSTAKKRKTAPRKKAS